MPEALEVAATHPERRRRRRQLRRYAEQADYRQVEAHAADVAWLDGEDDQLYPAAFARQLYKTLRRKHVDVESKIYPGQGHGFSGEAAVDSERRTNAFFDKHLAKRDASK